MAGCSDKHAGTIEASGTLEAVEVNVSAKVAGQIQTLFVDEGSLVKSGDTLAILDHATNDIELQQAKAGVDLADAQYKLLVIGTRSEDLRQAEEGLRQAASTYKTAKDDYERTKALFATKSVTKKDLDDAESKYTIAQAANTSAEQNLQKLRHFARPEDIAAAKARLDQAAAASRSFAERNLRRPHHRSRIRNGYTQARRSRRTGQRGNNNRNDLPSRNS